jgi:hypothetical protein
MFRLKVENNSRETLHTYHKNCQLYSLCWVPEKPRVTWKRTEKATWINCDVSSFESKNFKYFEKLSKNNQQCKSHWITQKIGSNLWPLASFVLSNLTRHYETTIYDVFERPALSTSARARLFHHQLNVPHAILLEGEFDGFVKKRTQSKCYMKVSVIMRSEQLV